MMSKNNRKSFEEVLLGGRQCLQLMKFWRDGLRRYEVQRIESSNKE